MSFDGSTTKHVHWRTITGRGEKSLQFYIINQKQSSNWLFFYSE